MLLEFKLPDIGEGVHEGEIVAWHVKAGDTVAEDQPLLDVMTDKVTAEIPSPSAGTVKQLKAQPGEVVAVGAVIVIIEIESDQGEEDQASSDNSPENQAPQPENKQANGSEPTPEQPDKQVQTEKGEEEKQQDDKPQDKDKEEEKPEVLAAPATRKLAQELGLDLSKISGTGIKGRITPDDVLKAADSQDEQEQDADAEQKDNSSLATGSKQEKPQPEDKKQEMGEDKPQDKNHSAVTPTIEVWFDKPENSKPEAKTEQKEKSPEEKAFNPQETSSGSGKKPDPDPNRRVPFVGIRKKIAEHLSLSKQKAPHFGYVEEADLSELVALRSQFKQAAKDQGATLTYLPFVIKAVIEGLKAFPILNSTLDEDKHELVYQADFNIGLAIATDNGLVVPVIKQADKLSILQLAQRIAELAEKARSNKLTLEEMRGGTFTITSIGSIGGLFGIPIINYPEVGILCFNKIQKRPVVKTADPQAVDGEDQVVIRSMSYLSMTCDHRVVDGAEAAKFIARVIQVLEHPTQLLLGV